MKNELFGISRRDLLSNAGKTAAGLPFWAGADGSINLDRAGHECLRCFGCRASFPAVLTSDLDIYRTANVLIREHGEEATNGRYENHWNSLYARPIAYPNECLLRVINGPPAPHPITSAIGG